MENKFFTFIKPYLSFIDDGHFYRKPFRWLYILLAVLNLIFPLDVLYRAFDNRVFDSPANYVVAFLIVWLVIAFASWLSFQLWWNRKEDVKKISAEGDEYIATPGVSHFIQTFGEWLGTWVGLVGGSVALITTLILGDEGRYLTRQLDYDFLESGLLFVVLMPIYGFLIIIGTRYLAEQGRALVAIADNTRKT